MGRVVLSRSAETDLLEIWLYVAQGDDRAADEAVDRIEHACEPLVASPYMGRERGELIPGIRSFPADEWVIFYRLADGNIHVIRIVNGNRDIGSML